MGWLELIRMPFDGILHRSYCTWLCCLLCQWKFQPSKYRKYKQFNLHRVNILLHTAGFLADCHTKVHDGIAWSFFFDEFYISYFETSRIFKPIRMIISCCFCCFINILLLSLSKSEKFVVLNCKFEIRKTM